MGSGQCHTTGSRGQDDIAPSQLFRDDRISIDGNEVKAGQELLYKVTYKNTTGKNKKAMCWCALLCPLPLKVGRGCKKHIMTLNVEESEVENAFSILSKLSSVVVIFTIVSLNLNILL